MLERWRGRGRERRGGVGLLAKSLRSVCITLYFACKPGGVGVSGPLERGRLTRVLFYSFYFFIFYKKLTYLPFGWD